jgi:hypothetical protein
MTLDAGDICLHKCGSPIAAFEGCGPFGSDPVSLVEG